MPEKVSFLRKPSIQFHTQLYTYRFCAIYNSRYLLKIQSHYLLNLNIIYYFPFFIRTMRADNPWTALQCTSGQKHFLSGFSRLYVIPYAFRFFHIFRTYIPAIRHHTRFHISDTYVPATHHNIRPRINNCRNFNAVIFRSEIFSD